MYSSTDGQNRVDRFVLAFALLLVLALAGMLTGSAVATTVSLPLMVFLLTLLSVLGPGNRWPDRATLTVVVAFHAVSTALWIVAVATRNDDTLTLAGMPTSTGVLIAFMWPLYALVSGPVYAYCAQRTGLTTTGAAR